MGRIGQAVDIRGNGQRAFVNSDHALRVDLTEHLSSFTADYAGAQTDLAIITPSATKKLHVAGVYVSTKTVNVDVTIEFKPSPKIVFKLYTAQKASDAGIPCNVDGAIGEVLSLTCGAGTFVCIAYREHG